MMKEKRKGMLQRGIMVAVSALTVVASAGTVLAYEPLPSSDYWFVVKRENGKEHRGHFTLKR